MTGTMAGLYTLTPALYPAAVRTTGIGWAIGMGRFGAVLSPLARILHELPTGRS
ncbi:MAG: hypothetical protein IIB73_11630 [Proteobacteria bacterium]|nr:hypothetical protein [Pseudomonadota bacterium]